MRFENYYFNEEVDMITQEMRDWFDERTMKHINLVQKHAKNIADNFTQFKELVEITKKHDESKLKDPEKTPYIFISWNYHCKDIGQKYDMPSEWLDKSHEATLHHVKHNKHHAEYYDDNSDINKNNRDSKPENMVDATSMPDIYVAEMCADWIAMGEEKGNTAKEWADKNVNIRWKFTDKQTKMIYDIISKCDIEEN